MVHPSIILGSIALPACVAASGHGHGAGPDTGTAAQSTPGWRDGTVQPCESPASAPSWVDDSDWIGVEEIPPETPTTSLSLATDGDDRRLAIVQVPDRVRWWGLDSGTAGAWLFDAAPLRASLVDLDADGRLDLLAWGDQLHVGWALGTADEHWDQLWDPANVCLGVQELAVFDADGRRGPRRPPGSQRGL